MSSLGIYLHAMALPLGGCEWTLLIKMKIFMATEGNAKPKSTEKPQMIQNGRC